LYQSYLKLDKLYVIKPGVKQAKSWSDYKNEINLKELKKFFKNLANTLVLSSPF
jgi:hypothetical protein